MAWAMEREVGTSGERGTEDEDPGSKKTKAARAESDWGGAPTSQGK